MEWVRVRTLWKKSKLIDWKNALRQKKTSKQIILNEAKHLYEVFGT